MKWEYMYVRHSLFDGAVVNEEGKKCYAVVGSHEFLIKKLDEFGAEGWELSGAYGTFMIFKRPV